MNILIPHTWLLEHLETSATPEEIQKYVSLCGPSVERIYDREGEPVYDIEVTTNRVDAMSVRGFAREAAVILPQFGVAAKLKPLHLNPPNPGSGPNLPLPTIRNNPELCHRIMCVALANVRHTPTPDWMAKRLRQIDENVHDSLIDITNYVTHDLGHPCHAFDYDQIMQLGGTIIVTEAQAGQPFTTLDGLEYKTVGGEVVFENPQGQIIDLPAVKGTANTAITDQTRNVLFWIEAIDHQKVRFASMTHAIRTVAAQLNEKQVDPHLAEPVLAEAVRYYQDLTDAQVASEVYDDFPGQTSPQSISVPLSQIHAYLGIQLEIREIENLLQALGCQVELQDQNVVVTPPTFRPDLEIPADVIEEIARLYGYHRLPSVLMPTAIPMDRPKNVDFAAENAIKHFLADIGWQELYTYSLVGERLALASGFELANHLKLANPLTDDKVYLRRSLIPSLEEVIDQNPQTTPLSVFELANVYIPRTGDLPEEELHLTLVSTSEFRQVKGQFEALLDRLFVQDYKVKPVSIDHHRILTQAGLLVALDHQEKPVPFGEIGVLPNGRVVIDVIVTQLWRVKNSHPQYQPIPKTAAIIEDLTFTVPETVVLGDILETIKQVSANISQVQLLDIYGQNYTFTIEYSQPDSNITSSEVEPIRKQIVEALAHQHQAQLVGTL